MKTQVPLQQPLLDEKRCLQKCRLCKKQLQHQQLKEEEMKTGGARGVSADAH